MGRYNIVSLFSGAGGLDLGFVNTGMYRVVFANDVLVPASATYSKNFGLRMRACGSGGSAVAEPDTVLACDISRVDFSGLQGVEVDVVVGGPPCQDFSIVRGSEDKRRGIEVRRGRLYSHFVRALICLKPKAFVFENVPGLISANRGWAYKVILDDFANMNIRWSEVKKVINAENCGRDALGYEILFSGVVDMTKLGLPQKRERLIIIGLRKDFADKLGPHLREAERIVEKRLSGSGSVFEKYPLAPIEVFEGDSLPNLQEKYGEVIKNCRDAWTEVSTPRAEEWKRKIFSRLTSDVIKDYLFMNKIKDFSKAELDEAFERHREILKEAGYLGARVEDARPPDGSNAVPTESPAVAERMKHIPPGENHEFVKGTKWEVKALMSNIYRRAHPLVPAPTVIAYGGGGTWGYHYDCRRGMLTNRERARLQSFPDSFLFAGEWSQVRAQIGEAVPPLIAKRIAEVLSEILSAVE